MNTPNAQPLLLQEGYDCGDEPDEDDLESNQNDLSREDDSSSGDSEEDENNTAKHVREETKETNENEKEPEYDNDNEDLHFDLEGKIDYNDNLSKTSTQVTTNEHLKFISTFGSNTLQKSKSKKRVVSRRRNKSKKYTRKSMGGAKDVIAEGNESNEDEQPI